jgi:hypothetical protein
MARKKKKSEQIQDSPNTEIQIPEQERSHALQESAPAMVQSSSKHDNTIELSDAARRFVLGFKEGWLASILKFAHNHNFPERASEEACKELLRRWGATVN